MNQSSTLIKLIAVFVFILLIIQLWIFFRKAQPTPALGEIRKEMARIDSLNETLKKSLSRIEQRTEMIDRMLAEELSKSQFKIDGLRAEITSMRNRSGMLQQRIDTLLAKMQHTGAPSKIPTLADLSK